MQPNAGRIRRAIITIIEYEIVSISHHRSHSVLNSAHRNRCNGPESNNMR